MNLSRRGFLQGLLAVPALWVPDTLQITPEISPSPESLFPVIRDPIIGTAEYLDSNQWPLMSLTARVPGLTEVYAQLESSAFLFLGVLAPYFNSPAAILANIQVPAEPFRLYMRSADDRQGQFREGTAELRFLTYAPSELDNSMSLIVGKTIKARTWKLV
jgi:hypothetical protein